MIEWSLFQLFLGRQNILQFFTQNSINDMMGQDVTMQSTGKAEMQCSFSEKRENIIFIVYLKKLRML